MSYSSRPLPSTLLLLNNLPSQPPGTKVRFLGWCAPSSPVPPSATIPTFPPPLSVANYSIKTGLLALEHHHTHHHHHHQHKEEEEGEEGEKEEEEDERKIEKKEMVVALVDVKLVRGSMKATDTMKGGWVNVVGYVQREQKEKERRKGGVRVQALMVWSAEGVRVREYESAVEEREKLG